MKIKTLALATLVATGLSTSAMAATWTLDYRHDYRDKQAENYDRICIIGTFENGIGFYIDSSFHSWGKNKPDTAGYHDGQWGDFGTNATEMSLWWGYKIADTGFVVSPGIITESTSEMTGYKPYVRLQYNTDIGLWFALRPRYDYLRVDGSGQDQKNARIDAWVGYKYGNFGINYNYTHMWALEDDPTTNQTRKMYDNNSWNYEHNVAINYRIGNWNPYFEVGNISAPGTATKDGRQTRLRLGVQYTF